MAAAQARIGIQLDARARPSDVKVGDYMYLDGKHIRVIQGRLSIIYYKLWFIRNKDCPLLSSVDRTQLAPSVGPEELVSRPRCCGVRQIYPWCYTVEGRECSPPAIWGGRVVVLDAPGFGHHRFGG